MVGQRSFAKERKLVNAVSTLKRAAGIPNSATKQDGDYKELLTLFEIYVPDSKSADILSNLLHQCVVETYVRKAEARNKPLDMEDYRHSASFDVRVEKDGREYKIILREMPESYLLLAETINKKAKSLIAPDKNPRLLKRPIGYDMDV
jgi:hypothetical protein